MKSKGLGRGLGALIPEGIIAIEDRVQMIPITQIVSSPCQPRRQFSEETLAELVMSIRECGIIQPILLKPLHTGYQLIAGERRLRAARIVGLATIPAIIRNVSDLAALEMTLIENLQRKDLNPIEEAIGFRFLADEFGMTQEQIADRIGKDRVTITNTLRLLKLPDEIQHYVESEHLSMGHAKVLLTVTNREQQIKLAGMVIANGWSVRALESYLKTAAHERKPPRETIPDPELNSAIDALRRRFGTKVEISRNQKCRGAIRVEFYSDEDLLRILELLNGE